MKLSDIQKICITPPKEGIRKVFKTPSKARMLNMVKGKVGFLNSRPSNLRKGLVKKSMKDSKSDNHSRPKNQSKPRNYSVKSSTMEEYLSNDTPSETSFQKDFEAVNDWGGLIFPELKPQQDSSHFFNEYGVSNIIEEQKEPGNSPILENDVTINESKIANSPVEYVPLTPEMTPAKVTPPVSTKSATKPPTEIAFEDLVLPRNQEEVDYFYNQFTASDLEILQAFGDEITNNNNCNNQSEVVTNTHSSYDGNYNQYNNIPFTDVLYNNNNHYSNNQLNSGNKMSQLAGTFGIEKLIDYNNSHQDGYYLPAKPVVGLTGQQIEQAKIGKYQKSNEYPLDLQRHGLSHKEKKKIVLTDGIKKPKRANKGGQRVMTKQKVDEFNQQTDFIRNPQFRPILKLTPALAGSLKCAVDYGNYYGDDLQPIQQVPELTNTAATAGHCHYKKLQDMPVLKNCDKRIKYSRDLTNISNSVTNMVYTKNEHFDQKHPYNPQWFRSELDSNGNSISKAKCGLCPYCPEIKFFGYRNGGYLGHLASDHGIGSNNYLVPEGINYGIYKMPKSETDPTLIESTGVECPWCHIAVKVGAQKNKNELLGYFRHWKTAHKDVRMNDLYTAITGHFRANIGNKKDKK